MRFNHQLKQTDTFVVKMAVLWDLYSFFGRKKWMLF